MASGAAPGEVPPPLPLRSRRRGLSETRRSIPFSGGRTILALILREMTSSYGRSPGGYVWMILEPVLGIIFLSAFFAMVGFRTPALGSNFGIFFATGILPFTFYNTISSRVAQSINFSKALLAYPRVTYVDAICARVILAVLTQLLVGGIILAAITTIWDTRTALDIEPVILTYLMALVLGVGIGLLNCFLATRFQIWQQVWSILMRPLFFVSGVIILYENIPFPWNERFLWNPLFHITAEMRAGFYPGYDADFVDPGYVFLVGLIAGLTGLIFLHRYHRDILEI